MKTSQKEGVSDRPPTPMTCPDVRHRSSAGGGWCQFDAVGRRTDRFGHSPCSHSAPPPDAAPSLPCPPLSTSNRPRHWHARSGRRNGLDPGRRPVPSYLAAGPGSLGWGDNGVTLSCRHTRSGIDARTGVQLIRIVRAEQAPRTPLARCQRRPPQPPEDSLAPPARPLGRTRACACRRPHHPMCRREPSSPCQPETPPLLLPLQPAPH